MAPVLEPLAQSVGVITKVKESSVGCVRVIVFEVEQPLLSVTKTSYCPAATLVKSSVLAENVLGPDHE